MQFNLETVAAPEGAHETILQHTTPSSSLQLSSFAELDVAIFDESGGPQNDKARRFIEFERDLFDLFEQSRFGDVIVLIGKMIGSINGIFLPVQERSDCVLRAFWDGNEFEAYRLAHPIMPKPVVWMAPSMSQLLYSMGGAHQRQGDYETALQCVLKAREYEPDHPRIWKSIGLALNWQDRFADALEAFRVGATVRSWTQPDVLSDCFYGQGVSLAALRRFPEAQCAFERALKLNPENESARQDSACVSFELQQQRKREQGIPTPKLLM